ncbi:MAG: hypothetical protein QOF24_2013 [Verrucomicrobiota bacterium]|jgi:hypothetical protein
MWKPPPFHERNGQNGIGLFKVMGSWSGLALGCGVN